MGQVCGSGFLLWLPGFKSCRDGSGHSASGRNENTIMKTAKTLFGILTITLLLGMNARSQVYHFSTPIIGNKPLSVYDSNGAAGSDGTILLLFSNLSETIFLDTNAQTIRQVGTVSYTPSIPQITFQETQNVSAFPNPPVNVSGTVTVQLQLSGGVISFDTGHQPVTWNANLQTYTFDGHIGNLSAIATWSLVTGSQTYTGSFSYSILSQNGGPFTFSRLTLANYPNSLQLSNLGNDDSFGIENFEIWGQTQVAATNGFDLQLAPGIANCGWNCDYFTWSANPATATNVPHGTPAITNQPNSTIANQGDTIIFAVGAECATPIAYQWNKDGAALGAYTNAALTITNVQLVNIGNYTVTITDDFGNSVTSSVAALSITSVYSGIWEGLLDYYPLNGNADDMCPSGLNGSLVGNDWSFIFNDADSQEGCLFLNKTSHFSGATSYSYVTASKNENLDWNSDFTLTVC